MLPPTTPAGDGTPRIPRHVAVIMDGNGRWAKQRGQPRLFGHRAGDSCANVGYDRYMTILPMQFNWNFLKSLRWSMYTTFGGGLSVGRYLDTAFAFERQ